MEAPMANAAALLALAKQYPAALKEQWNEPTDHAFDLHAR